MLYMSWYGMPPLFVLFHSISDEGMETKTYVEAGGSGPDTVALGVEDGSLVDIAGSDQTELKPLSAAVLLSLHVLLVRCSPLSPDIVYRTSDRRMLVHVSTCSTMDHLTTVSLHQAFRA